MSITGLALGEGGGIEILIFSFVYFIFLQGYFVEEFTPVFLGQQVCLMFLHHNIQCAPWLVTGEGAAAPAVLRWQLLQRC